MDHSGLVNKLICTAALICALSVSAAAQSGDTTVSEEFDLNIAKEQIIENDFARSTEVAVELNNIRVNVGARVSAARVTFTLIGITGHVTFRGSLESIRERLERFRSTAAIR